jgi:6-hydroxycyclohex-1-ene-1-carbonyl-CoA dehydrogenase
MIEAGRPLERAARRIALDALSADLALVRVEACGVCHTDVGFLFDGVRTGRAPPLVLGHEIAGRIEHASAQDLIGKAVVVPAVLPCGRCTLCRSGRGSICREQIFIGSDVDGGFASHVVVPVRDLCLVDEGRLAASGVELAELSVIADAASTAYQAIVRAELAPNDVAVFVGAGGVGGFGVQIARALGANVVALDVSAARLGKLADFGASLTIDVSDQDPRRVKASITGWAKENQLDPHQWKIFETSGHAKGQELAFSLIGYGATLTVVGYTLDKVTVRLSNLMAFDARAQGNWGCLPERYPEIVSLVLDGRIAIAPFVERRPMSEINRVFTELRAHALEKRPVLIPDFS